MCVEREIEKILWRDCSSPHDASFEKRRTKDLSWLAHLRDCSAQGMTLIRLLAGCSPLAETVSSAEPFSAVDW